MRDLQVYVHAHRPFPFQPSNWLKLVSNACDDVPGAEKLADRMPGVPLQSWNSFLALADADAENVGLLSYRRYPLFTAQHRCVHYKIHMDPTPETMRYLASDEQAAAALALLDSHDVIQFRPYILNMNVREQFACYSPPALWDLMLEELEGMGLGESLGYFEANNAHVWNALLVAKRGVVAECAEFVAELCRRLQDREAYRRIATEKFVSPNGVRHNMIEVAPEYAIPLWVFHKRLRSAYVPLVALDKNI